MPNRAYDEPNQSDRTLLVSVEDLIHRALGTPNANTVDFKLVQMILHILARQQRMLEQRVEIREEDFEGYLPRKKETESPRTPRRKKMAGFKEELKKKGTDKKEQQEKDEKERKQTEKEKAKADKEREKSPVSAKGGKKTTIAVSEAERDHEKILVVEKGPTARSGSKDHEDLWQVVQNNEESRPRGSIDVVTQSQFALLEATVNKLKRVVAPKPLSLPDNEQLKSDLARGSASLTDTMQAMQVDARVKAAEAAINRMTGILTQLAAAGGLSEDLLDKVGEATTELGLEAVDKLTEDETEEKPVEIKPAEPVKSRPSIAPRKSVAIDPKISEAPLSHASSVPTPVTPKPSQATSQASMVSRTSNISGPTVTHGEMHFALKTLHGELSKKMDNLITRATTAADNALHTAKLVADRLDIALKLDHRISTLYTLVEDYSEQLNGFDAGLTTQMQGFQDQIAQIRTDLKNGLSQLENVNNNAESAAVMELTERYQDLVTELDSTMHAHKALTALQSELGGEMHSLVECVEMLREQKCDRDEVVDGLRDKADATRLAGLLTEADFAVARADFEHRIQLCHDKFQRQEDVWMTAIRDLTHMTERKAELVELLSAREEARSQLRELHGRVRVLARVLGEPQAALVQRALAAGAACGACGAPARPAPPAADHPAPPCISDWIDPEPPSEKHMCQRWCGGSHTLIRGASPTRAPPPPAAVVPVSKYTGYGEDGRLYMMEEELKPCIECNLLSADAAAGAGDSPALPTDA